MDWCNRKIWVRTILLIGLIWQVGCNQDEAVEPSEDDAADTADASEPSEITPPTPGPLGMTLQADGITYLGTAVVDITPTVVETYTDLNDNHVFDGCFDDPDAERCDEPFDDVNGNGYFDAIFKGGFEPLHPALSVKAPISTRAFIVSHNEIGEEPTRYFAWVTVDVVGLEGKRFWPIETKFEEEGFLAERLLVTATHNHQAPDTIGLWGDPLKEISGTSPAYMERITESIEEAVRSAASAMQPVKMSVASTTMESQSPYFTGTKHGGKNPVINARGMINDIRDPRIISDRLLTMQANHLETGATVLTLTSWSGHAEMGSGRDDDISADWVGVTRDALEAKYGGTAIHLPEAVGGMQSALFMPLPLVDEEGVWQYQNCTEEQTTDATNPFDCFGKTVENNQLDEDGNPVPQWAIEKNWESIHSHGWHVANAVIASLETAEVLEEMYLDVDSEWLYVPVDNSIYSLIFQLNILELGFDDMVLDSELCVEPNSIAPIGCAEARAFRVRMGPVEFLTAPGEITPEVAWGMPMDDPQFVLESENNAERGPESKYFTQHLPGCDGFSFEDCSTKKFIDTCDCLTLHATPYILSHDETVTPFMEPVDARYKLAISMTDSYFSYILPGPDVHHAVTVLDEGQGDHFEDTVTFSSHFADKVIKAHQAIDARW
jgi:hypothetical protein